MSCQVKAGYSCNVSSENLNELLATSCEGGASNAIYLTDEVVTCVECFVHNHCLANNVCKEGTTGPTCERCLHDPEGYHAVGSTCVTCDQLPISAIIFLVFWALVISVLAFNRLSSSACAKVRAFITFGQLLILTFGAQVQWPTTIVTYTKYLAITFGSSLAFSPECYPGLDVYHHYVEWASAIVLPTFVFVCLHSHEKRINRLIWKTSVKSRKAQLSKSIVRGRRVMVLLLTMWYTPLARSAVHSNLCVSTIPKQFTYSRTTDSFLYDQRLNCDQHYFQLLNFVAVVYLIFFVLSIPPILLFVTLRFRKWKLLDEYRTRYGAVYETYTDRCSYWEAVVLLRKLLYILATDTYPTGALIQIIILMMLTKIYLDLLIGLRPYRKCGYNTCSPVKVHHLFEVISNICLLLLQVFGVVIAASPGWAVPEPLSWAIVVMVYVVVCLWLVLFLVTHKESQESEVDVAPVGTAPSDSESLWVRNKAGEGIDAMQLKQRQDALNF